MTKYVAIAKSVGRPMRVYGVFRSFDHAMDYAQHADPINAKWSVCELIEEEGPEEHAGLVATVIDAVRGK